MCWRCNHPDKTLDDYLSLLRERILTRGWTVQYVDDDRRPYAYTIGLHDRGLPEFLVTGLSPRQSLWLLDTFVGLDEGYLRAAVRREWPLLVQAIAEAMPVSNNGRHR